MLISTDGTGRKTAFRRADEAGVPECEHRWKQSGVLRWSAAARNAGFHAVIRGLRQKVVRQEIRAAWPDDRAWEQVLAVIAPASIGVSRIGPRRLPPPGLPRIGGPRAPFGPCRRNGSPGSRRPPAHSPGMGGRLVADRPGSAPHGGAPPTPPPRARHRARRCPGRARPPPSVGARRPRGRRRTRDGGAAPRPRDPVVRPSH